MADSKVTTLSAQVIALLLDEQADWLGQLARLSVDEVLARRVDELVTPETLLEAMDACWADEQVNAAAIQRYLKPGAERERARAAASQERVAVCLPEATADELIRLLQEPFPMDPEIVQELVDQKAVRSMLGSVLREAIVGFVSRSKKVPGLSSATDLVGALGRRASKGILGGVGRGIERQLDKHVTEFVDQSMARLTRKLADLVLSDKGQRLLGNMRANLARKALKTRVAFYYDEAAKVPADEAWALVPPILAHNLARPEIREALLGEVKASLERDGALTAAQLLRELGSEQQVRLLAQRAVAEAGQHVVGSPAFGQWLERLLAQGASQLKG